MDRIIGLCKQYRYVLLVLVLGIVLMLIPGREDTPNEATPVQILREDTLETRLAGILSEMEGVGKAQVLLTLSAGEETLYQQDADQVTGSDTGTYRTETILVTEGDRTERGLIRQVNPPVYLGAIVVCQGGGSPSIRLAVVEAVGNATGLTADKITVLKMK